MRRTLINILLSSLLLAIPIVSSPDFDGTLSVFRAEPFQREFLRFILVLMFFYLNLFVLLPKFLKKNILIYICIVLMNFAAVVFVPYLMVPEKAQTQIHQFSEHIPPPPKPEHLFGPKNLPKNLPPPPVAEKPLFSQKMENIRPMRTDSSLSRKIFTPLLPFLFSLLSSFFLFRNNRERDLAKEKAKTDLLNLQYQLQPHFLFNILNSIYSLAILKSDETPQAILKLSNIMRFVVQDGSENFVDLSKEIRYLEDYISLQLMRTGDALEFSFKKEGDAKHLKIIPLLLVNFIENAFKYGFSTQNISKIKIELFMNAPFLEFSIQNTKPNVSGSTISSTQTGISNSEARLKQFYPGKYELKILDEPDFYRLNLKMDLS